MSSVFRACALLVLAWLSTSFVSAQSGPFDVLCDSKVEVYSCHPPHPYGSVLNFEELRARLGGFGAATIVVKMRSGKTLTSHQFRTTEAALLLSGDTLLPRDIRTVYVKATWPAWRSVASMALGGAVLFGGFGLVIDGVQWVSGSGGDLGATGRGSLVGAALFGGMGILWARETYTVLIQEGLEQRLVDVSRDADAKIAGVDATR